MSTIYRDAVQPSLSQDRSAIRRYIQDTKLKIAHLQEECRRLNREVEALETMAPPIELLNDDVLRHIFAFCLPDAHNATMAPLDAPILLCHVSSRWRRLAMDTPLLWSSLHLYTYCDPDKQNRVVYYEGSRDRARYTDEGIQHRDQEILEWVQRAKSCKLSLSFGPAYHVMKTTLPGPFAAIAPRRDCVPNPNLDDLMQLFILLSDTLTQCDELSIVMCGHPATLAAFFKQPDLNWTNGERLKDLRKLRLWVETIQGTELEQQASLPTVLKDFRLTESEHLREVALYANGDRVRVTSYRFFPTQMLGLPPILVSLDNKLPWSQLQTLNLTLPVNVRGEVHSDVCILQPDDVLDVLRRSPRLESFSANIRQIRLRKPVVFLPIIVSDQLKHVSINIVYARDNEAIPDFILGCDWPAITSFHLRHDFHNVNIPNTFFKRIGSTLTSLNMNAMCPFPDILPFLPALIQLELQVHEECERRYIEAARHTYPDSALFLDYLTPKPTANEGESRHCCPRLQYLKWEQTARFSDKTLANFILARADSRLSVVPLKQVHIKFERGLEVDLHPDCVHLIEDGLDLRLEYVEPSPPQESIRSVNGIPTKVGILTKDSGTPGFGWR